MGCLVSSLNNDLKESSSGPAVTPPIRLNNSKLSENGKQSSIEDSATEACSDSQDKRAQISSPSVQSLNEAKISHCPEPARQSRKTSSYLEFPPGLLPKLKQPKHEASIPSILSQENLKTQNTEEQEREIQSEKLFNDHCKAQDRIRQEAMNQASLDNSGLLKGEIQDRGLELQETAYEECQEEERQSRSPSLQNISDPGRNLNRGSGITNEVEQASKPVSQTKRKLSRVNPNLAESIAEACGLEISNVQKKINEVNCEMEEKEMILESFPHLNGKPSESFECLLILTVSMNYIKTCFCWMNRRLLWCLFKITILNFNQALPGEISLHAIIVDLFWWLSPG